MDESKKYKIATLGCRTNQYESAAYAKQLRELGYFEATEGQEAQICIVNTCTVTEGADRSSRQQIRQLVKEHPGAQVVVTGCLADRLPQEIAAIGGVDLVVPNKEKESLLSGIFSEKELPEFVIDQFSGRTRAFVKVQDGCNSFCTYCIIPYVRGRSRSRRIESVVAEVEGLIASGYKEVVITGINVGDFDGAPEGEEKKRSLAELVQAVDRVEGLERLRISSIDPDEVDEPLLEAVINGTRTCHSMHIVLQSGSNGVLKKMNRKYTKRQFLEAVYKLKKASPHFTFTTDVIVGFPGESESDFQETLDLIREVEFVKVHMFPYSRRDRTRAALYPNQVPQEVIQRRKQEVLRLSEEVAFHRRNLSIGSKLKVLLESVDSTEPKYLFGHTDHFLEVFVEADPSMAGQIVEVTCIENRPKGLIGCLSK